MRRALPPIVALALALTASAPAGAHACSNAVAETDTSVAAVKKAEQLLNDGDPAEARASVSEVLTALKREAADDSALHGRGLLDRASRVLALADIRLDPGGPTDDKRRTILARATRELERLADDHENDPTKQTDLGEALARTRPSEGRKILEDLAERDLVTTPYGYLALARLRAADGDAKGRDEARARCERMAKTSSICQLEPSPVSLKLVLSGAAAAAVGLAVALAARRARSARPPAPTWRHA